MRTIGKRCPTIRAAGTTSRATQFPDQRRDQPSSLQDHQDRLEMQKSWLPKGFPLGTAPWEVPLWGERCEDFENSATAIPSTPLITPGLPGIGSKGCGSSLRPKPARHSAS